MPTVESLTKIASILREARADLCADNLRAYAAGALRAFKTNPHRIIHIGGWHFRTMAWFEASGMGAMMRGESEYLDGKSRPSGSSIVYAGD